MKDEFCFLTRTWKTGYRFMPPDRESEERFYRELKAAGIFGTEEPFALLCDGCVIAGGMETGKRDKEGRTIRFSFMLEGDANIFWGLAEHWDEAEKFMRSCIDWEAYRKEEIIFADDKFVNMLKSYGTDAKIAAQTRGHKLKWDKSGISELKADDEAKYSWRKIFAAVVMLAVIAIGAALFMTGEKQKTPGRDTELQEIYSGLRQALDTMKEAYTYMSMIDDDAGLALEYSRSKAEEAKKILDGLAMKLKSFDIGAGNL